MAPLKTVPWLAACLAYAAFVPMVGAQDVGQYPEGTIYFGNKLVTDNFVGGGGGSKTFEGTLTAPTAAADQKAYANVGTYAAAFETVFTWKATIPFNASGAMVAKFWVACDVATVYRGPGVSTIGYNFLKNGAAIGSASLTDAAPSLCTTGGAPREVTMTANIAENHWKVGDTMGAGIRVWMESPPESVAKNFHFVVGSTAHPSQIHGPGLHIPMAPPVTADSIRYSNETLSGPIAEVSQDFTSPTTVRAKYNWSTELASAKVSVGHNLTNGSAYLRILDGAPAVALNETFANSTEAVAKEFVLDSTTPGTWVIEFGCDACVGSFMALVEPPEPTLVDSTPPNEGTDSSASPAGSAADETPATETPGFEALAAVAAIGTIVTVSRRRA